MAEGIERLRVSGLEVVDREGRPRIVLGEETGDVFSVAVLDREGHPRVWMALTPSGPVLSMAMEGNIITEWGVYDDLETNGVVGPYLVFCEPDGAPRFYLGD